MAAIGTIRKHYGIVVLLIGFAIAAFVISDALHMESGVFFRESDSVGKIRGQEISYRDYDALFQQNRQNYINRTGQTNIDPQTLHQINDQTWNQIVQEMVMGKEYEDLGLTLTSDELLDLVQREDRIHPLVVQSFTDPETNRFDRDIVVNFLQTMDQRPVEQIQQWLQLEEMIVNDKLREKYLKLVEKSLYYTDLQAKHQIMNETKSADVLFTGLSTESIPDEDITFTDRQLRNFYDETKKNYKQEEYRSFEYVSFEVRPLKEDTLHALEEVNRLIPLFSDASNDSVFVRVNSERRNPIEWYPISQLDEYLQNKILDMDTGMVAGPFKENDTYNIAKLVEIKEDSINYYRASHILIQSDDDTDEAKRNALNEANRILNLIVRGADFAEMASEYGTDGTAVQGGDLGWFKEGDMVKEFENAVASGKKGDLKVVETEFGVHVIKITENKLNKQFKIAQVSKAIYPSQSTYQKKHREAYQLRAELAKNTDFSQVIQEKGLARRLAEEVKKTDRSFGGFENPREVIRWVFDNSKGSISNVVEIENSFVIVHITDVVEEGYPPLDKVRDEAEAEFINKLKKDKLKDKLRIAVQNYSTIEEIASSVNAETHRIPGHIFMNHNIPGFESQLSFTGAVFGLNEKQISPPVIGNNAVFVIYVESFIINEIGEDELNHRKEQGRHQITAIAQPKTIEALNELGDVQDTRYRFY